MPLLRADLENAPVFADRRDQETALIDVQRKGLFRINVLACLAGVNARQHPLKLLGGHDHRVDVLALEDCVIIRVDRPLAVVLGQELFGPRQVAVAQRHQLGVARAIVPATGLPDGRRRSRPP